MSTEIQGILDSLTYDQESGLFTWRVDRPSSHFATQNAYNTYLGRFAGKTAGSVMKTKTGNYISIRVNGKPHLAHRLVFVMMEGCFPENIIDHEDGDGTNNRLRNLRKCDRFVNNRNMGKSKRNTSGTVGVTWSKVMDKWHAYGMLDRVRYDLGYFHNIDDACKARLEWQVTTGKFSERHGKD